MVFNFLGSLTSFTYTTLCSFWHVNFKALQFVCIHVYTWMCMCGCVYSRVYLDVHVWLWCLIYSSALWVPVRCTTMELYFQFCFWVLHFVQCQFKYIFKNYIVEFWLLVCENICDSCVLIFNFRICETPSLALVMGLGSLWISIFEIILYVNISLYNFFAKMNVFYFSCLLFLTKISNTMFNRGDNTKYLYVVPDPEEKVPTFCHLT